MKDHAPKSQISGDFHALPHPAIRYPADLFVITEYGDIKEGSMHGTAGRDPRLPVLLLYRPAPFFIIQKFSLIEVV